MGLDITAYDKDDNVVSELRIPHWDSQAKDMWKRTSPTWSVSNYIKEIDIAFALYEFLNWYDKEEHMFNHRINKIKQFYKDCLIKNINYIEVI